MTTQHRAVIVRYDKKFLPAFVSLNRQWIEHYFTVEKMDLYQLENPEKVILEEGGEIFFVLEGERAVATCAMVPHGHAEFELAKMAVSDDCRGKGYGDRMMETVIAWAKKRSAKSIIILSNTILEPAIRLYHKHGAETLHLGPHPDYARCNIEMRIALNR